MYIAHLDHHNMREPHYLNEHVEEMIELIRSFQLDFDFYNMAIASAVIHDVGKKSDAFQKYIQNPNAKRGSVKHAVGGAYVLAKKKNDVTIEKNYLMEFVANIVAGHHSGLENHDKNFFDKISKLPDELAQIEQLAVEEVKEVISLLDETPLIEMLHKAGAKKWPLYISMLVRFVMSALVDADYISTEAYFSNMKKEMRIHKPPSFHEFKYALDLYIQKEFSKSDAGLLDQVKKQIQEKAFKAGRENHAFFALHAPTGTGKTIASLCFAIEHAMKYNKKRIITALPLTNLTEEVSDIYRSIFGGDHVIEDHSNATMPDEDEGVLRLAAENWDRSFVVTTTVQLFESLLHHRPMKLRKLHRLANSIIILDEYHKLPLHVLEPVFQCLDILQTYFNVTVLLMSATPFPLLNSRKIIDMNLQNKPVEITDYERIFNDVPRRVKYEWLEQKLSFDDLAEQLRKESSVLTIVNTRKEAQLLHKLLTEKDHHFEAVYYLSTTMCGAHRESVINEIRRMRNQSNPGNIAVISTSILEAGIDVSFPCVYRMLAPLESIVQAAGRCNRYGEIPLGKVVIFQLKEQVFTDRAFRAGIAHALKLLKEKGSAHIMEPESILTYYRRLFTGRNLNEINFTHESCLKFREMSEAFRMIEDDRISVICTKFKGFEEKWLYENKTSAWWRKIQPFTVSVTPGSAEYEEVHGLRIWKGNYDDIYGILL